MKNQENYKPNHENSRAEQSHHTPEINSTSGAPLSFPKTLADLYFYFKSFPTRKSRTYLDFLDKDKSNTGENILKNSGVQS